MRSKTSIQISILSETMKVLLNITTGIVTVFVNLLDFFISIYRKKRSKVLRYSIIASLTKVKFLNQDFVAQTFLEENRVINRFQIESDLKLFIDTSLNNDTIFWDIGGCIGNFSIHAGHTGSKVFVFEPDGLTYSSLLMNVFKSKLQNISVFPIALGNENKLSSFHMTSFQIANAYNSVGSLYSSSGELCKPQYVQNVNQFKASTLISENKFEVPTHIKIDVDGNELEILLGFEDYLNNPNLKAIFIEMHSSNTRSDDCHNLLVQFGFTRQMHNLNSNSYNFIYCR